MPTAVELYDEANRLKGEKQFEAAIEKLQAALALDEKYAVAYTALAMLYQKLGQHERAVEQARKACEVEPNDAVNFSGLSVICQRAYAGTGDHRFIQLAEDAMARSRTIEGGAH